MDQLVNGSFIQVLQIPIDRPIFMREVTNKMYSASAYYLAITTSSSLVVVIYPLVVTLTSFFFFGLEHDSFNDYLEWLMIMALTMIAGSIFGFTLGTFCDNEMAGTMSNSLMIQIFTFGAGFYANTGTGMNFLVRIITYVSPMRYTSELLMRRVLEGKRGGDQVLE